ncbi:MAG TPA: MFS transporter [Gemmatimonadaceae bacterium]|nr:MFS transporter [Gemmatimonadaceae bacterium]
MSSSTSVAHGATSASKRGTLIATIIASSMTFIDGTVVNVALPALQRDLGATITDVQWVIEAYALFLGALILVGGSLGDQLGRRRVFLSGVIVFTIASVLCGLAPSSLTLIAGRAVQGIGAAFLVPGSLAIITTTFDDEERGRAIGTWSGFTAIMTAVGPVLGGWLVEHASWRAVFFMNVPLAAIVVLLSLRTIEETKDPSRQGAIDWAGATLAVVGLSGIVFGLLEWPPLGPRHPLVLSALIIGVASLVGLVVLESRVTNPMLPLQLFASRCFTPANILTLFLYAALTEMLFLVPLELIQVQRYTATAAGAMLLPFPIIMFVMSRWSGGLIRRVGHRLPLTVGPLIAAVGLATFAIPLRDAFVVSVTLLAIVILGIGMAITVAPLTTTVMESVSSEHSGVASGVNNAVARVAGLIAIAVFGVMISGMFNTRATNKLAHISLSAEAGASVREQLPKLAGADIAALPSLTPQQKVDVRAAVDSSFTSAFRAAMLVSALLGVAAAIVGLKIV